MPVYPPARRSNPAADRSLADVYRFTTYKTAQHPGLPDLRGAHLVGADGVPVRGAIKLEKGQVLCETRHQDPVGLSLLWNAQDAGVLQLETTRLPLRNEPYHLHLELARHRLMRISMKREEWGLFDYPGMDEITARIEAARDYFTQALQNTDKPATCAELSDRALAGAIQASEEMAAFHAEVFLTRRQQAGAFAKGYLGVTLPPGEIDRLSQNRFSDVFDFVRVPTIWRTIQPKENAVRFEELDQTIQAVTQAKLEVRGGPLLNFGVQFVPDWMYIWDNDADSIMNFARDQITRVAQRYAGPVKSWIVAGGLQGDNVFAFNFEQIIEMTRMAAQAARQAAPKAQLILDLTQPWGEYYARNQQTIPPLLYAEMLLQSGVPIDAFGVQLLFGIDSDGFHVRDLFQVSSLIDRLANLGKPLHVTALAAPSEAPDAAAGGPFAGGTWHGPWSAAAQARWTSEICALLLSKPFVESLCFDLLRDEPHHSLPSGGLWTTEGAPKAAYAKLAELRRKLR